MKTYFLLFTFLLLVPFSAYAQKRAFTIEDFYRVKSASDAHISPDGRSLIYTVTTSDLPRAKRVSHIWMMGIDGQGARQLTNDKGESSPSFSPDGKWILYLSAKDGSSQIYLMPSAGAEAKKLTKISTGVSDPLWSPDGQWIAFTSFRDGNNEIYAMHADGTGVTRLTEDPVSDWQPRWGK